MSRRHATLYIFIRHVTLLIFLGLRYFNAYAPPPFYRLSFHCGYLMRNRLRNVYKRVHFIVNIHDVIPLYIMIFAILILQLHENELLQIRIFDVHNLCTIRIRVKFICYCVVLRITSIQEHWWWPPLALQWVLVIRLHLHGVQSTDQCTLLIMMPPRTGLRSAARGAPAACRISPIKLCQIAHKLKYVYHCR